MVLDDAIKALIWSWGVLANVFIRGCACHALESEISLESHIFGSKICKSELPTEIAIFSRFNNVIPQK